MKLCRDCKYLRSAGAMPGSAICLRNTEVNATPDYVNGGIYANPMQQTPPRAQECREVESACGVGAKWFEPK